MSLYNLKGIALSKYGSCTKFADAMGWKRNKAERILNGKQEPTLRDVRLMSEKMELTGDIVVPLFFGTMFTMRTNNQPAASQPSV